MVLINAHHVRLDTSAILNTDLSEAKRERRGKREREGREGERD